MLRSFLISLVWLMIGFSVDMFVAQTQAQDGLRGPVGITWASVGAVLGLLHAIYSVVKMQIGGWQLIVPPLLIVVAILSIHVPRYLAEAHCTLNPDESLAIAKDYINLLGHTAEAINPTPQTLPGCKLGFAYQSPDYVGVVVVDDKGQVEFVE